MFTITQIDEIRDKLLYDDATLASAIAKIVVDEHGDAITEVATTAATSVLNTYMTTTKVGSDNIQPNAIQKFHLSQELQNVVDNNIWR